MLNDKNRRLAMLRRFFLPKLGERLMWPRRRIAANGVSNNNQASEPLLDLGISRTLTKNVSVGHIYAIETVAGMSVSCLENLLAVIFNTPPAEDVVAALPDNCSNENVSSSPFGSVEPEKSIDTDFSSFTLVEPDITMTGLPPLTITGNVCIELFTPSTP